MRLKQLHWIWCDIRPKYNRCFSLAIHAPSNRSQKKVSYVKLALVSHNFRCLNDTSSSHLIDPNSLLGRGSLKVYIGTSLNQSLSLHWVCIGKENYFDQQFQSIPSVAKDWLRLHWSSFSNCSMVPGYWYYQNNHLLLIIRSSGEVLISLQLFVNNSQYVADSVNWSVGLGFWKKFFSNWFLVLYI